MQKVSLVIILFLAAFSGIGQTIKGKVTNKAGDPLIGANVIIENTFKGTATGANGEFQFTNLKKQTYTFIVSYMGYETLTEEVKVDAGELHFTLKRSTIMSDEIIVIGTRAKDKDPVAQTNISSTTIKENNLGQDIPFLLSSTPSFIATSDAGTGIGYTNFRIRGTDLNRINVTINGIPLNDAESHGVWWVNMPDFLSSTDNIQIQRGVGTSTNGAAAFGATINLQSKSYHKNPYSEIQSYAGSFNTFRNSISVGTGLLKDRFTFDARLSKITSDGFVDRATSNLESFYLSGAHRTQKSVLKFNIISGKEKTYQAWNGVPKVRLDNDATGMQRYLDHWLYDQDEYDNMINSDSRTYNFYTYQNETDNYWQNHYQLFYSYEFGDYLNMNIAAHYTRGKGYYEQYKKDEDFEDYQLDPVLTTNDTVNSTDLIRQKWLDNHFYGGVFSLNYSKNNFDLTLGGGWNKYEGDHFGEIIWAEYANNHDLGFKWYESTGTKTDFNIYTKTNYQFFNKLTAYLDLQYRKIDYEIDGIDDDLRNITQSHQFNFFNPKLGVHYKINDVHTSYFTFGIANREPNRSNFTDADPSQPMPTYETLYDYELGYSANLSSFKIDINLFYMDYKDQLVLTGEINDVGGAIMTNVKNSYRTGIEINSGVRLLEIIQWDVNFTLSQNKIKNFVEYIDNWDTWSQETNNLGEVDIAFSPSFVANSNLGFNIGENFDIHLISKYIGMQYIDNTSNKDNSLDPYLVNDLKLSYNLKSRFAKEIIFNLLVNNIFNHEYESNAWVYSYLFNGNRYTMDGYFPQAGINILGGITINF